MAQDPNAHNKNSKINRNGNGRYRAWCVTINNTHELPHALNTNHIKYYIFGKEKGSQNERPHLQGYIEFKKAMTLGQCKAVIGDATAHCERRRGTQAQAIAYCRKEDPEPFEYGDKKKGSRDAAKENIAAKTDAIESEMELLKALIKEGADKRQLLWNHSALYYKYKSWIIDAIQEHEAEMNQKRLAEWASEIKLNERQEEMLAALDSQTDRTVDWVCDWKGGTGKSVFSKYLLATRPNKVIRYTNAKTADVAMAYAGEEIVIFDLSRTVSGRVNYGVMEDLKNGMLFSGKYRSKSKVFARHPKVMVLANFMPDKAAMSKDRWRIMEWNKEARYSVHADDAEH